MRLPIGGLTLWIPVAVLVVHLFEPNQRAWYDIEGLWGDAEDVELTLSS